MTLLRRETTIIEYKSDPSNKWHYSVPSSFGNEPPEMKGVLKRGYHTPIVNEKAQIKTMPQLPS